MLQTRRQVRDISTSSCFSLKLPRTRCPSVCNDEEKEVVVADKHWGRDRATLRMRDALRDAVDGASSKRPPGFQCRGWRLRGSWRGGTTPARTRWWETCRRPCRGGGSRARERCARRPPPFDRAWVRGRDPDAPPPSTTVACPPWPRQRCQADEGALP